MVKFSIRIGKTPGSNPGESSLVGGLWSVVDGDDCGSLGGGLSGLSESKLKSLLKAVSKHD